MLASLSGEVFVDTDADGQKGPLETGAAAVRVYVDANDNQMLDGAEVFAETDAQGQYSLTGIPAGDHSIRVEAMLGQVQTSPRAYLGMGYPTVGDGSGTNPTQLYEMSPVGDVTPIGTPTTDRIHGLVRTNDGSLFGINFQTDGIYAIDGTTGQETLLSTSSSPLVAGLAYDPTTNTVYTLARATGTGDTFRLHVVNQSTGQLGPAIGSGLSGLENVSDLTFDTVNQRIVGFDNNDDQFFEFQTNGIAQVLSTASRPLNSWSLAFNGTSFVMFDQDDPDFMATLEVNPDNGAVIDAFDASRRIPTEGLFFARSGNTAHRLTLNDTDDLTAIDFGLTDVVLNPMVLEDHPTVINEILVDPLFGNNDTDQLLEFRGAPSGQLNPNTYFVIVDEEDGFRGEIHGIFDLSNQPLGANGMLVLLQLGSLHQVHADSAVLQSTAAGFGGLPGNIYTDIHIGSDRIDSTLVEANGYFLIESDVPPQLGDDIDADNDGLVDAGGVFANWNVLDSISLHPSLGAGSQAYGQILYAQEARMDNPTIRTVAPGTPVVYTDGRGYAARIGDSVGSDPDDWVVGTVEPDAVTNIYQFGDLSTRLPNPYFFHTRDLDHFGESNFVGGVRGTVQLTPDPSQTDPIGNPLPPHPAVGLTVLADTNDNGTRDYLTHFVDPDDGVDPTNLFDSLGLPIPQPLTNAYPGVTLSTADTSNKPINFEVRATPEDPFSFGSPNRVFSHVDIDFFNDIRKLRFDFYQPVSEVSIEAIGAKVTILPAYGRIEAYDANDQLIGTDLSGALFGRSRDFISVSSTNDDIAYAVVYTDTSVFSRSSPFGRFDRFSYRQLESAAITDANGQYEIKSLFPGEYNVAISKDDLATGLIGAVPTRIDVTRYENFVINGSLQVNTPPDVIPEFTFTAQENLPVGSSIGFVEAVDLNRQEIQFEILSGQESGLLINAATGELTVGPEAAVDFEQTPVINLTVGVSDSLATSTTQVVITLLDLNEAPVVEENVFFVAERTPNNTTIGQVEAFDPDSEQDQTLTFEIIGGSSVFAINPVNGLISLIDETAVDFEDKSEHILYIRVSDSAVPALSTDIQQVIRVIDENDPPVIGTTSFTVLENSTGVIGQLEASDPDATQTHVFELLGGTGYDQFGVRRNGEIVVRDGVSLDFEQVSSYTLRVMTIDSGAPPLSAEATVTITIEDVNEPPHLTPTNIAIAENSAAGTPVTALSVVDPENSGAAYEVSLIEGFDAANFDFDASTNALTVAENANLDFETKPVNTLVFEIVDPTGGDPTTQVTLLVELTDQNDAPLVLTDEVILSELAEPGTIVDSIEVHEPDSGDQVTVEIVGGNTADRFTLDPETRILRVADGAQFDADGDQDPLVLQVEVTDAGGLSTVGSIDVILNNVNEPPIFVGDPPLPDPVVSGEMLELVVPEDAFVDPEEGSYSLAVFDENESLPDWLDFDEATRTLMGLPTPMMVGSFPLTLRAFEAGPLELFTDVSFTVVVELGDTPLTNQDDPLDVDANGSVSASDALRVINFIDRYGNGASVSDAGTFRGFVDVSGNGFVTARDALLVINGTNQQAPVAFGEEIGFDDSGDRDEAVDQALIDLLGLLSLF